MTNQNPSPSKEDSLDDRLKKILLSPFFKYDQNGLTVTDEVLKDLKQAFAEAGYLQHDEYGVVKTYTHKATNVMSGKDWYDAFVKEAPGSTEPHVFEAARRASGLK